MGQKIKHILPSLFLILFLSTSFALAADSDVYVYRLNSKSSSEHLFTTSRAEVNSLTRSGVWEEEGIGWSAPKSGDGVYRLYNPALDDHLYTTDQYEVQQLVSQHGWQTDFNGTPMFYSAGSLPVYRLYNPANGRHHLTTDENEYNILPGHGWVQEGRSLSCVAGFNPYFSPTAVRDRIMVMQNDYPEDMPWTNENSYLSRPLNSLGYGCHAFALILSDAAFGNLPGRSHHDASNIKIGDILRVDSNGIPNNHSVVVTDINGDELTLAEGNWQSDIHWGRRAKVSDFQIEFILTRYPY